VNNLKRGDLVAWHFAFSGAHRGIVLGEVELPDAEAEDNPALRVLWFTNNKVLTRLRRYHTKVEVEGD